jgi:hypothetical protein
MLHNVCTDKLSIAVMLQIRIQEVHSLNPLAGLPSDLKTCVAFQSLKVNAGLLPLNKPRQFPFKITIRDLHTFNRRYVTTTVETASLNMIITITSTSNANFLYNICIN